MTKEQLLYHLRLIRDDQEIFIAVDIPGVKLMELYSIVGARYRLPPGARDELPKGRVELVVEPVN